MDKVLSYFNGDSMASDAWKDKYQMKDEQGNALEETPAGMHMRMAKEFARVEFGYKEYETGSENINHLSPFGRNLLEKRYTQSLEDITEEVFQYFDGFKKIVPQGSMMSNLGNSFVFGSLSNCFVIAGPEDSYGGIFRADEELVQLMKRRGGVGTDLDNLRPTLAAVTNAARTSSGVPSFAERYSNSTREVAQDGRRGALMLLLSVQHPDIFGFIGMKADRTKVTGANVSVKFTDEFMFAVEAEEDFYCRFPVDTDYPPFVALGDGIPYNTLVKAVDYCMNVVPKCKYVMRVKAKEIFDEFIKMAHDNAEPGAAYIDRIQDYCPEGVYPRFMPTKCNPCGEIWMSDYDACRLIAQNFLNSIDCPFTENAYVNHTKLYETSYMQQRYSDNLVTLELEYIERIIDKIQNDPENSAIRQRELELWQKVHNTTAEGRRTGNGFTALGDMLAALGLPYSSEAGSLYTIEEIMKTKMRAELDATIDMAITRGTFTGWNKELEFSPYEFLPRTNKEWHITGENSFFQMLADEFPEQAKRMYQFGRRNISWSTVAPTGTVSVMTQTTSGLEPLFAAYYIRRRKVNSNDTTMRVDFTDNSGDQWQEYAVLHPQFRNWILLNGKKLLKNNGNYPYKNGIYDADIDFYDKETIQHLFELSPWFNSTANDIKWQDRIKIQSVIQKYTSNSISSTINLPKDVSLETVRGIYMEAWKQGLKGVTIYRDGSRDGVLITETTSKLTNCDEFGYTDSIKRPKELEADYYHVTSMGRTYAVIVGLLNGNPYEVFAFEAPVEKGSFKGSVTKIKKGVYKFVSPNYTIDNLQLSSELADEKLLTRWVSMLLRHGANPKYIAGQVERSEMQVTSFAKVISRVLKKYIPDEVIVGETCPECHQPTVIREEGCKRCTSCGSSKC